MDYWTGEVNRTLSAAGVPSIMTFEYVPFGNAYYAIDKCKSFTYPDTRFCWANITYASKPTDDSVFDGKLVCQHGEHP